MREKRVREGGGDVVQLLVRGHDEHLRPGGQGTCKGCGGAGRSMEDGAEGKGMVGGVVEEWWCVLYCICNCMWKISMYRIADQK